VRRLFKIAQQKLTKLVLAQAKRSNVQLCSSFTRVPLDAKIACQLTLPLRNAALQVPSLCCFHCTLVASVSSVGRVQLLPGSYKEVKFKIELLPGQTAAAFELKGTCGSKAITFQVNETLAVKGEKEGVDISDGANYTAATPLNLSLLTLGVSAGMLDNASLTNGEILISATFKTNLYAITLANLKSLDDCDFRK
jgi:hypothetical protein